MKTKKSEVIDPDNPPQTDVQLREFRPVSPERQAMFRRAYINTFKKEPPVMGRPPKEASEKYRDVHFVCIRRRLPGPSMRANDAASAKNSVDAPLAA